MGVPVRVRARLPRVDAAAGAQRAAAAGAGPGAGRRGVRRRRGRGGARLLVARRGPGQCVRAAAAGRRAVVRRGGRQHGVQQHEHEHAQPQSAGARPARRRRRERRPVPGAAGAPRPWRGLARALLSPDVAARGVLGAEKGFVEPWGDEDRGPVRSEAGLLGDAPRPDEPPRGRRGPGFWRARRGAFGEGERVRERPEAASAVPSDPRAQAPPRALWDSGGRARGRAGPSPA